VSARINGASGIDHGLLVGSTRLFSSQNPNYVSGNQRQIVDFNGDGCL
jgi:hypothetical protein